MYKYNSLLQASSFCCPKVKTYLVSSSTSRRSSLDDWPVVDLFSPNQVVYNADDGDKGCDDDAVVHRSRGDGENLRPDAEETHDNHVDYGKCVVQNAPDPGQVPRTPYQLRSGGVGESRVRARTGQRKAAGAAAV